MPDFFCFAEDIRTDFKDIRNQISSVQLISDKVYQDLSNVYESLKHFENVSGDELRLLAEDGQSVNSSIQQIYHQMTVMLTSLELPVQQSMGICGNRLDNIRARLLGASDVYTEVLTEVECQIALEQLIVQLDALCAQLAETLTNQSQLWAHLRLAKRW